MIREIRKSDLKKCDEIYRKYHQQSFGIPNLTNTITSAIVIEDGEVVGFGMVKVLAEAIMVLDLSKSKISRLRAMAALMDEAVRACEEAEIHQMHVFVKDEKLARLLNKKYAFTEVTDKVMVKEI